MIRQPTPLADLYEWHRATLAGERPPRIEDEPNPGWYKRRFRGGGPFVPVRVWMHQAIDFETGELMEPETLRAEVNGQPYDPVAVWPYCTAISEADYHALVEMHRTEDLMAATLARVDLSRAPIRPQSSSHHRST